MKKIILALALITPLSACGEWRDFTTPKTAIEAVYYHERTKFSVMVVDGNRLYPVQLPYVHGKVPIAIIKDVKPDESMWYKCDGRYNPWNNNVKGGCEIHIRSSNNITGANWNHGKFGSGSTTRVDN